MFISVYRLFPLVILGVCFRWGHGVRRVEAVLVKNRLYDVIHYRPPPSSNRLQRDTCPLPIRARLACQTAFWGGRVNDTLSIVASHLAHRPTRRGLIRRAIFVCIRVASPNEQKQENDDIKHRQENEKPPAPPTAAAIMETSSYQEPNPQNYR